MQHLCCSSEWFKLFFSDVSGYQNAPDNHCSVFLLLGTEVGTQRLEKTPPANTTHGKSLFHKGRPNISWGMENRPTIASTTVYIHTYTVESMHANRRR